MHVNYQLYNTPISRIVYYEQMTQTENMIVLYLSAVFFVAFVASHLHPPDAYQICSSPLLVSLGSDVHSAWMYLSNSSLWRPSEFNRSSFPPTESAVTFLLQHSKSIRHMCDLHYIFVKCRRPICLECAQKLCICYIRETEHNGVSN